MREEVLSIGWDECSWKQNGTLMRILYRVISNIYTLAIRVARRELSLFLISSYFLFLAPRVRISDDIGHMAQRRF